LNSFTQLAFVLGAFFLEWGGRAAHSKDENPHGPTHLIQQQADRPSRNNNAFLGESNFSNLSFFTFTLSRPRLVTSWPNHQAMKKAYALHHSIAISEKLSSRLSD
jgi:hypothetical protein